MDKIHKIISLEQAKNRTPNSIQHYVIDYENNECVLVDTETWGGYCLDILIPKTGNNCIPIISWAYDFAEIYHFEEVEVKAFDIINHDVVVPGCGECDPEDVTIAYWVRYKNLMAMYHWLMNILIPSIDFYQKCENGYKPINVSDRTKIFETTIKLFKTLPIDIELSTGTIIGVTDLYDELIKRFISHELCQQFLEFMHKLLNEGLFFPLSGTTPYIDVELAITSKSTDVGLMSPLCSEWVEKKKYHLGEVVQYNGKMYILQECIVGNYDKFELTGELLKDVLNSPDDYQFIDDESLIPNSIYSITGFDKYFNFTYKECVLQETDDTGLLRYYLIQPYYTGYYNETTKTTSFDNKSRYWTLLSTTHNKDVYNKEIEDDTVYTGITESKLIALKRKVSSVDDFGEILPFIIKDDNPQNSDGELQYMIGVVNEREYDDGTRRGDALIYVGINPVNSDDGWSDIATMYYIKHQWNGNDWAWHQMSGVSNKYAYSDIWGATDAYIATMTANDDKSEQYPINTIEGASSVSEGDTVTFVFTPDSGNTGTLSVSIGETHINSAITSDMFNNNGYIKFIYIIGCELDSDKNIIPYTGVKYEEVWRYNKQHMSARIGRNPDKYEFDYIQITPIYNDEDTSNLDIINKTPILSTITYYGKEIKNIQYLLCPYVKKEDLLGIQDINTLEYDMHTGRYVNAVNGYIQRGTASALERHQILGEIKTFADLENYRNNFFQI